MDQFDLGRHEAMIETLMLGQNDIRQDISFVRSDVQEIKILLAARKGESRAASRAVTRMVAIGGSALALVGWVVEHLILNRFGGQGH